MQKMRSGLAWLRGVDAYMHVGVCDYSYVCVCLCVCLCSFVCIFIHTYIYIIGPESVDGYRLHFRDPLHTHNT